MIKIPFSSKKQMRYMFANHPRIAQGMANRQKRKSGKGVFRRLPNRAKKK